MGSMHPLDEKYSFKRQYDEADDGLNNAFIKFEN